MTTPAPTTPSRAVLLDTHLLLWLVSSPDKLSTAARELLAQ
jgi:PIN domain nuclease of toxin-antitoxin system